MIKESFQLLLGKYTVYSLVTAILQCRLTIKTRLTFHPAALFPEMNLREIAAYVSKAYARAFHL